ncbi:MAG: hypothetical protein VX527_04155, partial [Planctomycetota bacterium]|nr:hypothetical protein [Planctomycetota bacterium]
MRRLGWVAACGLLVMEGSHSVLAHWEAAPLSHMVDQAQRVFVGRLSEITSESSTKQPSSIELRFTVEWSIDDALASGDQTTLTSKHAILQDWGANDSGHISWETGRRYLIFAGSPTGGRPVTYENSVLAVIEGDDGIHYPVTLDWRAIRGVEGGLLRPTRRAVAISDDLAELVPSMAQQIEPIDTTPDGSSWCIRDTNSAPAMTLEALIEKIAGHYGRSAPPLDLAFDGAMLPPPPERGSLPCICDVPIELPVVMEQVTPSHWSYLQNAYAMSRFNDTVDVFRSTPGNDTWSHGEGIYEFAGWPSTESCQLVYGDPNWTWGFKIANSRTIYYFYCGGLIESSVTFNPYVSWEKDFHVGGAYHYGNVLMHELGHVVGLQQVNCEPVESYTFDFPSIMMAASRSVVEDGRGLHMIDALLLRSFYDVIRPTPAFHDIGVESWWANGHPKSTEVEPAVVTAGEEITLDRFTVENIGTDAVYDIRVQIYLSENTTITTSDIKLGNKVRLTHLNQAGIWEGGATRTIPWWVPAGTYYVGLRVSIGASASGDDYVFNNATYLTSPITVQAGDPPPPVLVTHLFDAIPAGWTVWFNSMSQEDLDDPPGYCGGVVTTGPGQAWDFDVPEDGELEVSNLDSAAPAP